MTAPDPYQPVANHMITLIRKPGGIAATSALLLWLPCAAPADDQIVTVADYFELTNQERHKFDYDIRQSEFDKMYENDRAREAVCVLGRFIDENPSDDRPSDGLMFMWQILDMARREGRSDMDAGRLIRGVMIAMFKQCEQDIADGKFPAE